MIITSQHDFKLYREAGEISTEILSQLKAAVKPGIYPIVIDQLAEKLCQKYHVRPSFKGVNPQNPYQYSTCISINEVVVHGLPSWERAIKSGDIIKLDFGIVYQGLFTDQCVTVIVKPVSPAKEKLVKAARDSVQQAIPLAVAGNRVGVLSNTMQRIAVASGFDVLKQYTGHGIGRSLHESPAVPAFGPINDGEILEPNMVLCLESQVVAGSDEVVVADDGWSVRSKDKGLSAMFEYMVVVGRSKPTLLTPTLDWGIIV